MSDIIGQTDERVPNRGCFERTTFNQIFILSSRLQKCNVFMQTLGWQVSGNLNIINR